MIWDKLRKIYRTYLGRALVQTDLAIKDRRDRIYGAYASPVSPLGQEVIREDRVLKRLQSRKMTLALKLSLLPGGSS